MGYRSEVAYAIKFKSVQDRDAFVTLMLAKNDAVVTEAINDTKHDYEEPLITYYNEWVKWYPDFSVVQAHHAFLAMSHELYDAAYKFLRIGEEDDDVETEQEFSDAADPGDSVYGLIELRRCIDINFPSK